MKDECSYRRIAFLFLLPLLVAILAAILTGTFWTAPLVAPGLWLLNGGVYRQMVVERTATYVFHILIGFSLLLLALWFGGIDGRWLWALIWFLAAIPLIVAANNMRGKTKHGAVIFSLTASHACILLAIISPFLVENLWRSQVFYTWTSMWIIGYGGLILVSAARLNESCRHISVKVSGLLIFFLIAVLLTLASQRLEVGVMSLFALILIYIHMGHILEDISFKRVTPNIRRYFFISLAGLFLLVAATAMDGLTSGWTWSPVWVLSSVPFLFLFALLEANKGEVTVYFMGTAQAFIYYATTIIIVLICLLFALIGLSVLQKQALETGLSVIALLLGGYMFLFWGLQKALHNKSLRYILLSLLGFITVLLAGLLSSFIPAWSWVLFWMVAGTIIFAGTRLVSGKLESQIGVVLTAISLMAAIITLLDVKSLLFAPYEERLTELYANFSEIVGIIPLIAAVLVITLIFLWQQFHIKLRELKIM